MLLPRCAITAVVLAAAAQARPAEIEMDRGAKGSLDTQEEWCSIQNQTCLDFCDGEIDANSCNATDLTFSCRCAGESSLRLLTDEASQPYNACDSLCSHCAQETDAQQAVLDGQDVCSQSVCGPCKYFDENVEDLQASQTISPSALTLIKVFLTVQELPSVGQEDEGLERRDTDAQSSITHTWLQIRDTTVAAGTPAAVPSVAGGSPASPGVPASVPSVAAGSPAGDSAAASSTTAAATSKATATARIATTSVTSSGTTTVATATATNSTTASHKSGISKGAIAGIVIGVVVGLLFIAALIEELHRHGKLANTWVDFRSPRGKADAAPAFVGSAEKAVPSEEQTYFKPELEAPLTSAQQARIQARQRAVELDGTEV